MVMQRQLHSQLLAAPCIFVSLQGRMHVFWRHARINPVVVLRRLAQTVMFEVWSQGLGRCLQMIQWALKETNMTYGDTHTMSTLHTRCCNMTTILHSTSHVSQAFEEYPDDADMPGARPCRNNWLSKPRMVGCGHACACSRLTDPCFL